LGPGGLLIKPQLESPQAPPKWSYDESRYVCPVIYIGEDLTILILRNNIDKWKSIPGYSLKIGDKAIVRGLSQIWLLRVRQCNIVSIIDPFTPNPYGDY
jgi:hypothetical protein